MKRILTIIAATICFWSCEAGYTEFWSEASYATIDAITGTYTLYSGTWSSTIDLSGEGFVTDDILYQMVVHGWTGVQKIRYQDDPESISVLNQSIVMIPESPEYTAQVNLYVPFPEFGKDVYENEMTKAGRCNIDMSVFQFRYKVDSRGDIIICDIEDRRMCGYGGMLRNVAVRFEEEYLYFEAETSFYDWTTETWQDGKMNLTYRHN